MRPQPEEYAPFYETYVNLVPENDFMDAFQRAMDEVHGVLDTIPADKADYAYAEGKWTVKQLLQHIIDTERVFSYRAACIARGEKQSLPGFNENEYAAAADVETRSLKDMKEELLALKHSVYLMFKGFTPEMLKQIGTASGKPVSTLALGYISIGHIRHHFTILHDRYGI
ncbi:MAG: DinB family protein [Sphingobacteriales bacterium]|nr:MAG: DinB family protein [Sphingobacteriales bacterium]